MNRYSILEDGSLIIPEASISDSGVYVCNATNQYGFDTHSGVLNDKRKTRIQSRPTNQEVRRGSIMLSFIVQLLLMIH
jgi:hypothetical protein